ncbi:hypothetical protein HAX54_045112 [Datura stramonium]|uniref:Uncharacterized protein n=1 Tax=Datura stramonium TaxID=4076 RepID=A0ABS8WHJ8_DATST|nr:hypothetical protein [Datura stramonium]
MNMAADSRSMPETGLLSKESFPPLNDKIEHQLPSNKPLYVNAINSNPIGNWKIIKDRRVTNTQDDKDKGLQTQNRYEILEGKEERDTTSKGNNNSDKDIQNEEVQPTSYTGNANQEAEVESKITGIRENDTKQNSRDNSQAIKSRKGNITHQEAESTGSNSNRGEGEQAQHLLSNKEWIMQRFNSPNKTEKAATSEKHNHIEQIRQTTKVDMVDIGESSDRDLQGLKCTHHLEVEGAERSLGNLQEKKQRKTSGEEATENHNSATVEEVNRDMNNTEMVEYATVVKEKDGNEKSSQNDSPIKVLHDIITHTIEGAKRVAEDGS